MGKKMLVAGFSSIKMHLFGICFVLIGIKAYSTSEQPCINLIEDSWNVGSQGQNLAHQIFKQAGQLSLYSTSSLTELQNNDVFKPLLRIPHGIDIINRILIALFRCDQAFINSKFQFIEGGAQQQDYMASTAKNFQQQEASEAAQAAKYAPMSAPLRQIPAQQQITQAQGQTMQPAPQTMQMQSRAFVGQPESFPVPPTTATPNSAPLYSASSQIPMPPQAQMNQVPVMYMPQPLQPPAQSMAVSSPPPAPMAIASPSPAPIPVPSPPITPYVIASPPAASIPVASPPAASIPVPSPPPAPIVIASSPAPITIASPPPAQIQQIPFMMVPEPPKLQVVPQPEIPVAVPSQAPVPVQPIPVIVRQEPAQVQAPIQPQTPVQTYQQPVQKVPVMFVPVRLPIPQVKPRPEVVRSPPPVPQLRPRCRLVCN